MPFLKKIGHGGFDRIAHRVLKSCQCGTVGRGAGLQVRVASRSVPLSLLFVVLRASPSTPGVSAHLRPRIVALREELDHSQAGERGGKEQCVCVSVYKCVCVLFVGEVSLEAQFKERLCFSFYSLLYLPSSLWCLYSFLFSCLLFEQ